MVGRRRAPHPVKSIFVEYQVQNEKGHQTARSSDPVLQKQRLSDTSQQLYSVHWMANHPQAD